MSTYPSTNRSRREFLKKFVGGMMGSASVTSAMLNLQLTGSLAAAETVDPNDYRALVCVFLLGGNDSFNMLAPVSGQERADYESARGDAALPLGDFLPLMDDRPEESRLGLHRLMPGIHSLYENGKAAFVANVGTLAEPTTLEQIQLGSGRLPLGLFSHSDQQKQWQSGLPRNRNALTGWAGRVSDLLNDLNGDHLSPMSMSFAGMNLLQSGQVTQPLARSVSGSPVLRDWNKENFLPRKLALEGIYSDPGYEYVFQRHWARENNNAVEVAESLRSAFENAGYVPTTFNQENPLSVQLEAVAKGISARISLEKKRQTFFVTLGGWDIHNGLSGHPESLRKLDEGITEFQRAMEALQLSEKVTLFTASDFGRTLSPNGGGTDHGWGGNQIVVGNCVAGGKVYGDYPSLALDSPLDVGRGRMIPTTSVDEFVADLALWMGVSPTDIPLVIPNIGRFHDVIGGGAPLGIFS